MKTSRMLGLAIVPAVFALALGGCASGDKEATVPVRGKILKGGLPFSPKSMVKGDLPPGDPGAQIVFRRMGGSKAGEEYIGTISDSGDFEVQGYDGKGIPESRYQVTVYVGAMGSGAGGPTGGSGGAPGAPPVGGGSRGGEDDLGNSMGKQVLQTEIEIPPGGKTDIVLEIDAKKK